MGLACQVVEFCGGVFAHQLNARRVHTHSPLSKSTRNRRFPDKTENKAMRREQEPTYVPPHLIDDTTLLNDAVDENNLIQPPRRVLLRSPRYRILQLRALMIDFVRERNLMQQRLGRVAIRSPEQISEISTPTSSTTETSSTTSDIQIEAQPQLDAEEPQRRGRTCTLGKHKPCLVIWGIVVLVLAMIFGFAVLGLMMHGRGIAVN